tara:strand:- start:238 stop:1416 length:1179 start_codon:yes stop_codon:yes gene_type:complete
VVEEKKWLNEQQFLNALSFCMLLPGPEAMQIATYAGWRLHGIAGGLAAGLTFVLPGAAIVLALAMICATFGDVPVIKAIFRGIQAAVIVIVIEALLRISNRALARPKHWGIASASFIMIFFLALPFPVIILLAALYGYITSSKDTVYDDTVATHTRPADTLRTILTWLAIWIVPLVVLALFLGSTSIFTQLAWFFSKLALVTFGGAYAVLAYMTQDVVTAYGWLDAGQMMEGLGLAETTPGPLILVTEFVGYLAAYQSNPKTPLLAGLAGAAITLWATFAPCFLWVFAGAPYIEWINARPRLKGAMTAITAAVVGVILNLAIWFGLHVFFRSVEQVEVWPLQLWVPDPATLDWRVVFLAAISGFLLLRLHWGIPKVLVVASALALGLHFAFS